MNDWPALHIARNWAAIYAQLTPAERAVLPYLQRLWLRPEQWIDLGAWRTFGLICGRGWGKSHAMASFYNRLALAGYGRTGNGFGLCAQNEDAVHAVQVRALVETAPPWNVPRFTRGAVEWPSGARAVVFSAEAPEAIRGWNLEATWCTELVAWNTSGARATWENLSLCTRVGLNVMTFDTTSKGRRQVILDRIADHNTNPGTYPLRWGSTYDNVALGAGFLADLDVQYPNKASRRYQEEVLGRVFEESGSALWQHAWIEDGRREVAPPLDEVIVALDPSRSDREGSDEFGLVIAGRARDGHIYVLEDHSGLMQWDQAVRVTLDRCQRDAVGFIWESNNSASSAVLGLLNVQAQARGLVLHTLPHGAPMPRRYPGRIYVREAHTDKSKEARADAPSALYAAGKVHHVGNLSKLEDELTSWEPGGGKSPNRLDALCYAVNELSGADREKPRNASQTSAAEAAKVHAELRERMRAIGRGRKI